MSAPTLPPLTTREQAELELAYDGTKVNSQLAAVLGLVRDGERTLVRICSWHRPEGSARRALDWATGHGIKAAHGMCEICFEREFGRKAK